jgi:hypothetical protein
MEQLYNPAAPRYTPQDGSSGQQQQQPPTYSSMMPPATAWPSIPSAAPQKPANKQEDDIAAFFNSLVTQPSVPAPQSTASASPALPPSYSVGGLKSAPYLLILLLDQSPNAIHIWHYSSCWKLDLADSFDDFFHTFFSATTSFFTCPRSFISRPCTSTTFCFSSTHNSACIDRLLDSGWRYCCSALEFRS